MIEDLNDYKLAIERVRLQLKILAVYRVRNQKVMGDDDIENIKIFYDSYQRIVNMIENLFEDCDFKSVYTGLEHE